MEAINPTDLIALAKNPTFEVLVIWILKEAWANSKKKTIVLDTTLKDLADKVNNNTLSIVRLETKQETSEKDISAAHQKIRDLGPHA